MSQSVDHDSDLIRRSHHDVSLGDNRSLPVGRDWLRPGDWRRARDLHTLHDAQIRIQDRNLPVWGQGNLRGCVSPE